MNWLSKLSWKSSAKQSPSQSQKPSATQSAAKPALDVEAPRRALAAAVGEEERARCARNLGLALAESARGPLAEDPPEVWMAAICHAKDKALARTWLDGLNGDARLGEVASHGRYAEVRLAAAQRIADAAVLEQVAQACRDKDRGVYRHCADRLRQHRQAGECERRAAELAGALRTLLEGAPLLVSHVLNLEKAVRELGEGGEALAQCDTLLAQAHVRLRQEAEALRGMQTLRAEAEALRVECGGAEWPWTTQLNAWRARFGVMVAARDGLPAWQAKPTATLNDTLRDIEARLAALAGDDEMGRACEQFLDALSDDTAADPETVAAWDALAKPGHPPLREALLARWRGRRIAPAMPPPPEAISGAIPGAIPEAVAAPAPVEAPPAQPPRRHIDPDALRAQLDALEQAIEQGHLAEADAEMKRIEATLGGDAPRGATEARLRRAQAQLGGLRGWARWGAGQAHEHLVAAAAALLQGDPDVDALAVAVPALRNEWKRLNASGPASKSQWEAFDAALEKAYLPVAARHAEMAARQAEARQAKEALCAGWEAEWAAVAWEHADYTVVAARRQEMLKQWRAAPQSGFRDERVLRKRFDALLGDIDGRLEAGRDVERARREQIIAAAEALRDAPDLGRAMIEAKALQGRWRQPEGQPRLDRGDEQKLWQRFRAACDAVFARRDAQRAEQSARQEERSQARQAMLDAFAKALEHEDPNEIKRALGRFRVDWDRSGPREADSLEARAQDLQRQAQARIDARRQERYRARFDLLARKAALAEDIEMAAVAAQPLDDLVAAAKQAWEGLPSLPGPAEGLLADRLAAAAATTAAQLAAGRASRESLLLDLEIALDLPSPAAYAEARRDRQIGRLRDRFGAGPAPAPEPEAELARWYATAAAPDAALERRLSAVVHKLTEQGAASG